MRLRRPRHPKLRTRVLLGVLAVMLVALVAFDVAAVTALRGYLVGQADSQLQDVLGLYRVSSPPAFQTTAGRARTSAGASQPLPSRPEGTKVPYWQRSGSVRKVIAGPRAFLPGALGQFEVVTVSGRRPTMSIRAGPDLIPQLPPDMSGLARSQQAVTVPSRHGGGQLRLMAESFPSIGVVYATTSLAHVDRTVGQLELILVIGSAAAGLVAAGGVAWVMRRGLRPIETMAGQADRINAGDLTDRVSPHDPRTEMGRLGEALNGMLARIGDFVAEREASQEASRRFFADASHELRTPLASLRANAELYQQGVLSERSQVDEAMRRITLEAQRMGGLVDDMLRLARLDQHPGQQCETVDLSALAAECVQRARTAGPERTWTCGITGGLEVTGDEELLRRAIDNVLGNVAAHTPQDAPASLTVTGGGGEVAVQVSDEGPGVPPDQLPRIFDRFYRAGAPSRRPGSGLGLAIVAAVAAAHQGSVAAALNEPHGLRITLTLPATSSGLAQAEDEERDLAAGHRRPGLPQRGAAPRAAAHPTLSR